MTITLKDLKEDSALMTAPIIQVQYEDLKKKLGIFTEYQSKVTSAYNALDHQLNILQKGAWESNSANTYYASMHKDVLPGVKRLAEALGKAAETLSAII